MSERTQRHPLSINESVLVLAYWWSKAEGQQRHLVIVHVERKPQSVNKQQVAAGSAFQASISTQVSFGHVGNMSCVRHHLPVEHRVAVD